MRREKRLKRGMRKEEENDILIIMAEEGVGVEEKRDFRKKINFFRRKAGVEEKKEESLYDQVQRHSQEYMKAFGLQEEDLPLMESRQGQLGMKEPTVTKIADMFRISPLKYAIDKDQYALVCKNVLTNDYGDLGWKLIIMAVSNNPKNNINDGYGTTLINTVNEEVHKRIVEVVLSGGRYKDLIR